MIDRIRRRVEGPTSDRALAVVLGALAEADVWLGSNWRGPAGVNAAAVAVLAGGLLWRRRHALWMTALTTGIVVALTLAYGATEAPTLFVVMLVVAYSAAAHAPEPLVAATVLAIGLATHDVNDSQIKTFGDAVYDWTMVGLAFGVGLAMRLRQAQTTALKRAQHERAASAVEEERRRIARELHDVISHSLGLVVLQAGAAEQVLERDPAAAREMLRSIRATGQEAIGEMATLLAVVREEPERSREPQPSLADIGKLAMSMRHAGLSVEIEVEGEPRELPAAVELSAFRIVQEGLTNALKHATAACVCVTIRYDTHELEVQITDDGTGAGNGNGNGARRGLAGIGERVAIFGGSFEAGPRPEGGWILRAALPLP